MDDIQNPASPETSPPPTTTPTNSDGALSEARAVGEQLFPGVDITAKLDPEIFPGVDTGFGSLVGKMDESQRAILKLEVLRLANDVGIMPELVVARATAYQNWIDEK